MPPIFQPEVAAEAIAWAAHHDRPEVYVGWPTVKAIVGNKIAPRFADWYLAREGYNAQQTDEPVEADRADNLWETVPGDHGAHGDFDARSRHWSSQFLGDEEQSLARIGRGCLEGRSFRSLEKILK